MSLNAPASSAGLLPTDKPAEPPHAIHAKEQGLAENARYVLRTLLLLNRANMPGDEVQQWSQNEYLCACYELMEEGLMVIEELPNKNFQVRLTRLAQTLFPGRTVQ